MRKNNSTKRVMAGITAVLMASVTSGNLNRVFSPDGSAQTVNASADTESIISGTTYVPSPDIFLPDSDEAFAGYTERVFYGNPGLSFMSVARASGWMLDSDEQSVVDTMKEFAASVADGKQSSSVCSASISYDKWRKLNDSKEELLEFTDRVMTTLLSECPYELYWFDKTKGINTQLSYRGNKYQVSFYFVVAQNYMGKNMFTVDTAKTGAASSAAENAKAVVSETEGLTTYQKLKYFKDYICQQVKYNYNVQSSGESYGDPWQIIYVFDNDSDTDVVCEGYAKAFKYLCDLSGIQCSLMTGNLTSNYMNGGHMWNVVTIDGENYMVDVTNCDYGTTGHNYNGGEDYLFMQAPYTADPDGYTYEIKDYGPMKYELNADAKNVFSEEERTLSAYAYKEETEDTGNTEDSSAGHAVVNEVSATLDGTIGLNFYISLPDSITEDEGVRAEYYVNGLQMTKEFVKDMKCEDGIYKFTYHVNAKEMHDVISVKLFDGNNDEITLYSSHDEVLESSGTELTGSTAEYSVADYFDYMMNNSEDAEVKSLVKTALAYGNEVQKRFGYDTDSVSYTELDEQAAAVTDSTLEKYRINVSGSYPEGLALKSMSLVLETETTIKLYFTADDINKYTFEIEGQEGDALVKSFGRNYVEIRNISADDLDKNYKVKINGEDCVINVSALSYAYASVRDNTLSSSVMKKLYLYNQAANEYFK